jgi:nicotinate-nucleotide pyrophosphorylase (carboxylating)
MLSFSEQLDIFIKSALDEDVGSGDHSTLSCIDPAAKGRAVLKIKQDGILAGIDVAERIFRFKEPETGFFQFKRDGEAMKAGEQAFEVEALIHTILQCERLVLNCLQRMSGIATLTHQYAQQIKGYKTRILDTRKTTPNFRLLEKMAVHLGGGMNHRFGLYDMIMLKDNHVDYCGGIAPAIRNAHSYMRSKNLLLKIEIETRNLDEVKQVMAVGMVDRIMLDNFTPAQIEEALKVIGGLYETEASGGINLDNIVDYAKTGVDFISIGALIHQAKSLDMSLKAMMI